MALEKQFSYFKYIQKLYFCSGITTSFRQLRYACKKIKMILFNGFTGLFY